MLQIVGWVGGWVGWGKLSFHCLRPSASLRAAGKNVLKLNLLLILSLKVWNKIVHKSWKSKKSATITIMFCDLKALLINIPFLTMLGLQLMNSLGFIQKIHTQCRILLSSPQPYGLVFLWGHYIYATVGPKC
jgi:hypothetical protein